MDKIISLLYLPILIDVIIYEKFRNNIIKNYIKLKKILFYNLIILLSVLFVFFANLKYFLSLKNSLSMFMLFELIIFIFVYLILEIIFLFKNAKFEIYLNNNKEVKNKFWVIFYNFNRLWIITSIIDNILINKLFYNYYKIKNILGISQKLFNNKYQEMFYLIKFRDNLISLFSFWIFCFSVILITFLIIKTSTIFYKKSFNYEFKLKISNKKFIFYSILYIFIFLIFVLIYKKNIDFPFNLYKFYLIKNNIFIISYIILKYGIILFLAALWEELFTRYILIDYLSKIYKINNFKLLLFISSFVFTIFHFKINTFPFNFLILYLIYIFVFANYNVILRLKYNNVYVNTFFHFLTNFIFKISISIFSLYI